MRVKLYCVAGLLVAAGVPAWAQNQPTAAAARPDSAGLAMVRQPYARALRAERRLLSGTDYVSTLRPDARGHAFFESATAQPATIFYDGEQFSHVPLMYDIQRDKVIMQLPESDLRMQLLTEKVEHFSLGGHYFVRRTAADSVGGAGLPPGFYEQLVPGTGPRAALLARYIKRQEQEQEVGHLIFVVRETRRLYLQQGNTGAEVSNLRDLLRLLPAHQEEVQQYARKQHLKFKNSSQQADAAQLVAYYNSLLSK